MPVHAISPEALQSAFAGQPEAIRGWCATLEAGGILYFPHTPVPIPLADLEMLLGQQQTGSALHKNIAYKPNRDELTGVDAKSSPADAVLQLHQIMRRYSGSVESFLARFSGAVSEDAGRWTTPATGPSRSRIATCPRAAATTCCIPTHFPRAPLAAGAFYASSTTFIPRAPATGWWASRFRGWWAISHQNICPFRILTRRWPARENPLPALPAWPRLFRNGNAPRTTSS